MNRIITILVTIFILLLGYIWISHVWGTEKPRQSHDIVDANELDAGSDLMADAEGDYAEPLDTPASDEAGETDPDAFEDREAASESEDPVPQKTEPVKQEPVSTPVTKTPPAEPKPAAQKPAETKPAPKPTPVSSSASATSGKHLVIAGNFTQLANAEQRIQELKKAGYPNAEVVRFDLSEFHTVCAGRYDDVNEARKVAKKLKDYNQIDAYVRIGG